MATRACVATLRALASGAAAPRRPQSAATTRRPGRTRAARLGSRSSGASRRALGERGRRQSSVRPPPLPWDPVRRSSSERGSGSRCRPGGPYRENGRRPCRPLRAVTELVAPGGQASAQGGKRPPHLYFDGLSRDLHHLSHLGVAQVVVPAEPEYLLAPRGQRADRTLDRVLELGCLRGLIAAERRSRLEPLIMAPGDALLELRFDTLVPQVVDRAVPRRAEEIDVQGNGELPLVTLLPQVQEQVLDHFLGGFSGVHPAREERAEVVLVGPEHRLERRHVAGADALDPRAIPRLAGRVGSVERSVSAVRLEWHVGTRRVTAVSIHVLLHATLRQRTLDATSARISSAGSVRRAGPRSPGDRRGWPA